jgi:2-keto-4-pentenoate hydratase/2-oxohepta-3-ene-1,7-dioic acid hydratase in catechol pathway
VGTVRQARFAVSDEAGYGIVERSTLCVVHPSKIVGVGQNYRAHAKEMGKPIPEEPLLFLKPTTALIGPGGAIVRPRGYERVDYEGELCVVIGRRAHRVSEAEALDQVFGYTILNDVTVRDLQRKDVQFTRAKGFDTFAPAGPCIATGIDPANLRIRTRLNGETRQDSSTSDMIFPVAKLVSFISHVMTLLPGDLITTGTPPGVGNLTPGDRVAIEIDGIGTLENPVVDGQGASP